MTDTAQPPATFIPNRPAEIVIGGRRFPIDAWPMGRAVDERRPADPIRSDGEFILEPARHSALGIAARYVLAGVAGVVPVVVGVLADGPPWASYLFGFAALTLTTVAICAELRC